MKRIIEKIAFVFLMIAIFVVMIILCSVLVEKVLLPFDFLFYEGSPIWSSLFAPLLIVPSLFVTYYIVYYLKKKITSKEDDFLNMVWFGKLLGKWKIAIIAVWIMAVYANFTSLTYVTNDRIVIVTPLNPSGQEYSYSDVEKIETGFGNKKFSLLEYQKEGNFYYKIILDGKEIVFHMPSQNPSIDRYEDTYLELEEFDQALNELNISKESSSDGYDKCNYDQRYVDRFLRIVDSN